MLSEQQRGSRGHGHAGNRTLIGSLQTIFQWSWQLLGHEGFPLLWAFQVFTVRAGVPVGVVGKGAPLHNNNVDVLVGVEVHRTGHVQPVSVLLSAASAVEQVDGWAVGILSLDDRNRNNAAVHRR